MTHAMTGNRLDVVYDYEGDVKVLRGLQRHGSDDVIPLPDPMALVDVLTKVVNECRVSRMAANEQAAKGNET